MFLHNIESASHLREVWFKGICADSTCKNVYTLSLTTKKYTEDQRTVTLSNVKSFSSFYCPEAIDFWGVMNSLEI